MRNKIKNKFEYSKTYNLRKTILKISQDLKNLDIKKVIILLSPSAASYDQFKNFEEEEKLLKD